MITAPYTITLIGCGKMGSAMLSSWLENERVQRVDVITPNLPHEFAYNPRIHHRAPHHQQAITSDILVLAIKPQILEKVTHELAAHINKETLILSLAAGKTLETLSDLFTPNQPIIRSMPNIPVAIGEGVTVCIANPFVSAQQKNMINNLLQKAGMTKWIEDENLMNSAAALSGSGPAYLFYLVEALAQTGEKMGLDAALSMSLARQTMIGSAALLAHEDATRAATLRENVTSPNGTTQAALDVLMDGRLQDLLNEALKAAKIRAEAL